MARSIMENQPPDKLQAFNYFGEIHISQGLDCAFSVSVTL